MSPHDPLTRRATAEAAVLPTPRRLPHEETVPAPHPSGRKADPVDPRLGEARRARLRAESRRRAAGEAAGNALVARQKADAKGQRVGELEARLRTRRERPR